nr:MAG: wsv289-like protein [Metapenaeopsis lamellata majanivirus]
MPRIEYNTSVEKHNKSLIYDDCIYDSTINLINKTLDDIKLKTTGAIPEDKVQNAYKFISIKPIMIIVNTNTEITKESISTKELTTLIDRQLNLLSTEMNYVADNINFLNYQEITTSNLLEIKSALPTIINLENKDWEISENGRIEFELKGNDGLKDFINLFDIGNDTLWSKKVISKIDLEKEAIFYPHLNIIDLLLENKVSNRHVIFRLNNAALVITSPLYSIKKMINTTTINNNNNNSSSFKFMKNFDKYTTEGQTNKILSLDNLSFARIRNILKIKDYTSLYKKNDIDDTYYYYYHNKRIENKKQNNILLTKGYIPGYTTNDDDNNTSEIQNEHMRKMYEKIDFLICNAVLEKKPNQDTEGMTSIRDCRMEVIGEDLCKLIDDGKRIVKTFETSVNIMSNESFSCNHLKVHTLAIFDNLFDANIAINRNSDNNLNKPSLSVDIKINGNLLSYLDKSEPTAINLMDGSAIFSGGQFVANFMGDLKLQPMFEKSFLTNYYYSISIEKIALDLLNTPCISSNGQINTERYRSVVKFLYKILFENDKEVENKLNNMAKLALALSHELFSISGSAPFEDRLWNVPHWDFPIGTIVSLYIMLFERYYSSNELWNIVHGAVLKELLGPIFDFIFEKGVWVSYHVQSFIAWTIEDMLLPLLNKKCLSIGTMDTIMALAFHWIVISSATRNGGLCNCFPNSCTWFYLEPKRKLIDYVYSPIPKFILCGNKISSEIPTIPKELYRIINEWVSSKRITDRIFTIRNFVTPKKCPLVYTFIVNPLNGLRINIKSSSAQENGDFNDNQKIRYKYSPPLALLEKSSTFLPLGTLNDLGLLESSLNVFLTNKNDLCLLDPNQTNSNIIKILKQKKIVSEYNNNDQMDDEEYIHVHNGNIDILYCTSLLSQKTLNSLKDRKKDIQSHINDIADIISFKTIEEITSPVTKGCIDFYNTDNDGFSWLFKYGSNFNLETLKVPLTEIVYISSATGLEKLDKLLSLLNVNITNNNNDDALKKNNNTNMRTLVPFPLLEHLQEYHQIKKQQHDGNNNNKSFNIDNILFFIYKHLPMVLESIALRVMITCEAKEIELVKQIAINVSRIIADSLLICLDPKNALNVKMTLEEPVQLSFENGIISLRRKKRETNVSDNMIEKINQNKLNCLASSEYVTSLIKETNIQEKYFGYIKSLLLPSLSIIFTQEEKEIIDQENSPILKNMMDRRGFENINLSWNDDNILKPYIVPTFQTDDGSKHVLFSNMPDNVHIYVPIVPSSILTAKDIKIVLNTALERTKHLNDLKKKQIENRIIYGRQIIEKIKEMWMNSNINENKIKEALQKDQISYLRNNQLVSIKNEQILSKLPYFIDVNKYHLHLAIKNITDIDYYLKVPNFWRMMNIERMLVFAIELMLIQLGELINVGLDTAKQLSRVVDVTKCLYNTERSVIF